MLNGSSIWTPISSMPSSKKVMMAEAGTMAQCRQFHRVKGISAGQMTKNLPVSLQGIQREGSSQHMQLTDSNTQ